jgi:hypothetical protein
MNELEAPVPDLTAMMDDPISAFVSGAVGVKLARHRTIRPDRRVAAEATS